MTGPFENNISEEIMMKKYKNSLAYYSLSSRLCEDKRFIESLFIAKKAEEVLVREKNYKRLLYLNVKMMHCLNSIHSYQECYDLATMQLLTLKSFVDTEFETKHTIRNLVICCLPLKKYKKIIELLTNINSITLVELCCLMVAKYNINSFDYKLLFESYNNTSNSRIKEVVDIIDAFLKSNDKKELSKLDLGKQTDIIVYAIKKTQII